MEEISPEIAYPSLNQVIDVNRRMIELSGGSFTPPTNLRNRNSLEYILIAIRRPVFGRSLFSSLKEKAASLTFEIIVSHVFFDGNKRTGIHLAWEFLKSNGISVYLDLTAEEIAVELAKGNATRDDFLEWLHNHQ